MSIIIQAGHRSSYSKLLMQKMYERGLSKPINSFTHQLNCRQVTETIDKVLSRGTESIANHKLADNVMIDFLLANLDSENWGWAAEKNLASLKYWQQLEPDVRFILVFDHPNRIFEQISSDALTSECLDQIINDWIAYHQNMLNLVELLKDSTVLVEGEAAISNITNLNKEIKSLTSTFDLKSSWQLGLSSFKVVNNSQEKEYDALINLLSEEILREYPRAIEVFNKLLSKAAIKHSINIHKAKKPGFENLISSMKYIKALNDTPLKIVKNEISTSIIKLEHEKDSLFKEKDDLIEELLLNKKDLVEKSKELQSKLDNSQKEIERYKSLESNFNSEKNSLISQMHAIQQELQKYYSENQELKDKVINQPKDEEKKNFSELVYYGAAKRIKEDLPYRLGSTVIKSSKSPFKIASLPLALTKEYKDFQSNTEKRVLPNIEDYLDATEGAKVKNHLSYRLGKVILDSINDPRKIFTAPLDISKTIIDFKKNSQS